MYWCYLAMMTLDYRAVYMYSLVLVGAFVLAIRNVEGIMAAGTKEATLSWPFQLLAYGWGAMEVVILKRAYSLEEREKDDDD